VRPGAIERDEVRLLALGQLGLLAAEAALGLGDLHALARARAPDVGLDLGDHGPDVEEQPSHRVGGVVDRAAEVEAHLAAREVLDDVAGVG
jgi:hypothetical protein